MTRSFKMAFITPALPRRSWVEQVLRTLTTLLVVGLFSFQPLCTEALADPALNGPLASNLSVPQATAPPPAAETPYWIWAVLPRLFPEYLPGGGGYLSLGFAWPEGDAVPRGIMRVRQTALQPSFQRLDCAACHQVTPPSAARSTDHGGGRLIQTASFSHAAYQRFLTQCATDPRFSADYILPAIRYNIPMNEFTAFRYRAQWIPQARKELLRLADAAT